MVKIEQSELNGFFGEMKNLKSTEELKKQADQGFRCLIPLLEQLNENLEARKKISTYPNALRKTRKIFKNYEDEVDATNEILRQISDTILEYIKHDSQYKENLKGLYEKFDNGEYKTE